jgi:hypothetical protein
MDRQRASGDGKVNPEFMNRMFMRMNERLEDKFTKKPELAFMK